MSFKFFIAKRYAFSKKKYRFLNLITFVSISGIAIGVSALIIATSLINGFQRDIRDRLFRTSYHLMVVGPIEWQNVSSIIEEINRISGIRSITPVIYENVLVRHGEETSPGVIRGLPEEKIKKEWFPFIKGENSRKENILCKRCTILGGILSENLGAFEGDTISIILPSLTLSPFGVIPKRKTLKVSSIVESGLYEFDSTTLLVEINSLRKILNKNQISYVGIKIGDIFAAEKVKDRILKKLSYAYPVITWKELNAALFSALKLEKLVMFLTIALIVFVASLNIIATLILIVMDKLKDIGVLSALGATPSDIKKIFVYEGMLIGISGTVLGLIFSFVVIFISNYFELIKVPYKVYHISHITLRPEISDIVIIILFSFLLGIITTIYPAKKAAEIDPAEVLREE